MSKESFITFARNKPELAKIVLRGDASWQQLYELYEIYGEKNSVWDNYLKKDIDLNQFKDLFEIIKKVDLNQVQSGIENVQKTIGLLQDIGFKGRR